MCHDCVITQETLTSLYPKRRAPASAKWPGSEPCCYADGMRWPWVLAGVFLASCSFDWDTLDPRLGDSRGGEAGRAEGSGGETADAGSPPTAGTSGAPGTGGGPLTAGAAGEPPTAGAAGKAGEGGLQVGGGGAATAGAGGVIMAGAGGSAGAADGGAQGGSAGGRGAAAGAAGVAGTAGVGESGTAGMAGSGGAPPGPCEGPGEFNWGLTGHCYRFVSDTPLAWAEAEAECEAWGGTLAVITTAQENAFIASEITDYTWLGASDAATEDDWQWVTGEAWSYQSFAPDEPNASGNCLHMWRADLGEWDDIPCDTVQSYLCEQG